MAEHLSSRTLIGTRWTRKSDRSHWRVYQQHRADRQVLLESLDEVLPRPLWPYVRFTELRKRYREES